MTRHKGLRVVGGGARGEEGGRDSLDESAFLARSKQLKKMRLVLAQWRKHGPPPHLARVESSAVLSVVLVLALGWIANRIGIHVNGLVLTGAALGLGIVAGAYVHRRDDSPRSHSEHLDMLLAGYEPIAKDAYRYLQAQVRERGAIEVDFIEGWLKTETDALRAAAGRHLPSAAFLGKNV